MLGVRCFISAMTARPGLRSAVAKSSGAYAAALRTSSAWSVYARRRTISDSDSATRRVSRGCPAIATGWSWPTVRGCWRRARCRWRRPQRPGLASSPWRYPLRAARPLHSRAGCPVGAHRPQPAARGRYARSAPGPHRALHREAPLQAQLGGVELVLLAPAVDLDHVGRGAD